MPVSSDEFRSALSRFASGVTVVTTRDAAGDPHGLTVSAFCSVSLEPPLVLICVERSSSTHFAFEESGVFAVNILSSDQQHVSETFAAQTDNKFEITGFDIGVLGLPLLRGCVGNLECTIANAFDGGDHSIFVGRVDTSIVTDLVPLVYLQGDYRKLCD